jgi:gas vesicle protein
MSKTMLGFLAGAAVGALAGILLAPDKGSETRKKIASKAGDIKDSVKGTVNEFADKVKETYSSVKGSAQELKEEATAKMNTARNEVKNTFS